MKTSFSAAALLVVLSAAASAQTSVQVYGILDAGLVHESGGAGGPVTKLTSGIGSPSRFGFRGTENLGGGLSAKFVIEGGFSTDTGVSTQNNTVFGRATYVSLEGGFGALTMGRMFTPYYVTLGFIADPFGAGFAGTATNLMATTGLRMSNTVKYVTPNMRGFTGELAYGFGEIPGDTSAGRALGAALAYARGPLHVRLAHHDRNNDMATARNTGNAKNTLLTAVYNFGIAKTHLAYGVHKGLNSSALGSANPFGAAVAPRASTDSNELLAGVTLPFGASTVMASFIRKNDRTAFDQDADQWALGYVYALSRRTDLYTSYARINNKRGAGYTVGNGNESGSGDKAFNLGVRHTF